MNLKRWSGLIFMAGLLLAFSSLSAQAGPYRPYHHPHGKAYGWHSQKSHGFERHHKHFRRSCGGANNYYVARTYGGPPPVAYVAPVAPVIVMQPQPYYSQPATPGFSGSLQYNF